MVDLRPLIRKHEAEIRAFRRYLFTDAADSTATIASDDGIAMILSGESQALQRFGPVKSVTDRHAQFTIVADVVDQAVMLEDDQLRGSLLTFSVVSHHRQLHSRLTVNLEEAVAWIRAILGPDWSEHVYGGGALSTTGSGQGPQRLTTQFFYLFITPAGKPHDPPANFHLATTPIRDY